LGGRNNLTDFSTASQDFLIGEVSQFAQPVFTGEGNEAYLQRFDEGTNILALVPGGDLASEYIIVGAHYDHLGGVGADCFTTDDTDQICNGAADNAAGVAAAVSAVRTIAAEGTPRRTVVLALWDSEEDGLLGSEAYLADPAFPVEFTVAYVNFDIQGAALLPSLADVTFAIGAETGGNVLAEATARAMATSTLQPMQLSRFLFEGRSDHSNFADAGVPAMLFSDATGGCYHTAQDEADIVDFAKLDAQVAVASALVTELAATDAPPRVAPTPEMVFDDALRLLSMAELAETDSPLLSPRASAQVAQFASDLRAIVAAGADAFDGVAVATVLSGVDGFVQSLTESTCESFASLN